MGVRGSRAAVAIFAAAVCAVAILAVPASGLVSNTPPTTIKFYGSAQTAPDSYIEYGKIFSQRAKCIDGRTVKWIVTRSVGPKDVVDKGVTSDEGAFSGAFTFSEVGDAQDFYVKVSKEVRGTTTCLGAREAVVF
jgi:hypothetical protein